MNTECNPPMYILCSGRIREHVPPKKTSAGETVEDSHYAPFFSAGMILWACLFVKFWKRQEALLSVRWGSIWTTSRVEVRPEFTGALVTLSFRYVEYQLFRGLLVCLKGLNRIGDVGCCCTECFTSQDL